MKKLLVVCLGVMLFSSLGFGAPAHPEAFTLADRVGEQNERSFFLFSTSVGKYTIRHDGMGEVFSLKGRKSVFNLKLGAGGRIDRIYYLEHQGDLFLLYEVHDASSSWAYLVRMAQTTRKVRWLTPLESMDVIAPEIVDDVVVIKDVAIFKSDGRVKQD